MHYIPNTPQDQAEMLATLGVSTVQELFGEIPESLRLRAELDLPPALAEPEVFKLLRSLVRLNIF